MNAIPNKIQLPHDVAVEIAQLAGELEHQNMPWELKVDDWFIVHDEKVMDLKYTVQRRVIVSKSDPYGDVEDEGPWYAAEYEAADPGRREYNDYEPDPFFEDGPIEFTRVYREEKHITVYSEEPGNDQ